ncbi:ABC transporter substrate-binding protein [Enterococcus saccharolyticus]|uniref:ABC transporter substrate-binding protein n=1 Tax=Candidatus Enterococcus willemsii TaxID=1857215 RepID=A0ABQ6YW28_9ENTE|nr:MULTISPECIES: ABC transporter substrate-binding protein [Enterococcus]KAF1301727.1 ABC transporter substrate-binding protein [Enterococcus sp. CU12B]MCD5003675.1 ABC transporter substrate-binding protein [Enterococcus saccharolyticus]
MKKSKVLVFTISLLLLLAGCGDGKNKGESTSSGDETEKVTLDFWSFWGSGMRREVIEEIIEDFNDSQNEIEVKYSYQPWGDIWTKSLSAITAGNPPDVIVQDINSVAQRAEAKQSVNLTEFIDKDTSDKFYPQLWEAGLYGKDTYGIPFNTDTYVIFYNKKIFREAGIEEKELPTTWEELETTAQKLDIKKGNAYERIGFYPLWNISPDIWAVNADGGTGWFDGDKVAIDTPNKVDLFDWILKWQEHYGKDTINRYEAEFGSGVSDPFVSGLVTMVAQNINYYSNLVSNAPEDFEFGIIPLPEKEKGEGHWTWGGGFVLEVPYGAKNPEASYKFIDYLTSTEVQEKFGEKSFDIMANREANENLINSSELSEDGQMVYQVADEQFKNTVLTPAPLKAPDFANLVNEQIDQILLGTKKPEEGLEDAQKAVEKLVDQNN